MQGDKIGHSHTGMFCMDHGDLRAGAKIEEIANAEAALAFKTELAALGHASGTPEISSFDAAPPKSDPDYRVGGVLQSMELDECSDGTRRKGDMSLTVKWEVFAPKLQKVVLATTTTGTFHSDSFETVVGREFESRAYVASLQQLMTDPNFKALQPVAGPGVTATASLTTDTPLAPLHLKQATRGQRRAAASSRGISPLHAQGCAGVLLGAVEQALRLLHLRELLLRVAQHVVGGRLRPASG